VARTSDGLDWTGQTSSVSSLFDEIICSSSPPSAGTDHTAVTPSPIHSVTTAQREVWEVRAVTGKVEESHLPCGYTIRRITWSSRRQHGQKADGHARRTGVDVDPEGYPGQDDDEHRRNVDLNEEVADVTAQDEQDLETWVRPCRRKPTTQPAN